MLVLGILSLRQFPCHQILQEFDHVMLFRLNDSLQLFVYRIINFKEMVSVNDVTKQLSLLLSLSEKGLSGKSYFCNCMLIYFLF